MQEPQPLDVASRKRSDSSSALINLESEPGRGSAFTVTLPRSAEMPAAPPIAFAGSPPAVVMRRPSGPSAEKLTEAMCAALQR
jgi:hypothetical protein